MSFARSGQLFGWGGVCTGKAWYGEAFVEVSRDVEQDDLYGWVRLGM
jgi:hypothetical protein